MRRATWTASALLAWLGGNGGEAQWNQFRGPEGRGIAPDGEVLPVQLDREKNLLWTCPVPGGHSSPVLWDDRIFLTGHGEKELLTLCIDRASGKELWRRSVRVEELEKLHEVNSPASSTPVTDGERVYVYFGAFGLVCYDLEGEEQWRRPLPVPRNTFGSAASPIVAGDYLVLTVDTNADSWLETIDRKTGKTVWRKAREGFGSGWSTPVHWRRDGVDELIVYGVWWLTAYALEDGSERWSVPGLTDEPIVTPVTGDGLVYVTSYNMRTNSEVIGLPQFDELLEQYDTDGDGALTRAEAEPNESVLSRFDAEGEGDHPLRIFFRFLDEDRDGKLTAEEWQKMFSWLGSFKHANALIAIRPGDGERETELAWQHTRGVPECPSPLFYDGNVYIVKNGGIVSCLDAKTGTLEYQERLDSGGPHYASPVAGDGKIYSASARGVVTVFAAGKELNVLARNDLGERIMATPALVGGRVYVRTERNLYAFGASE